MRGLTIGPHILGESSPLVVAEIGVNHDGDVAQALRLVEEAKNAGADAVKLQLFRADRLMHSSAQFAQYQKEQVADVDPAAMLRRYELSDDAVREIVRAIREAGLLPIATPFSLEDMDLAASLNLAAVKIASPDVVNKPLLKAAAKLGKPLLVSCGAATMEEIATSVTWLGKWYTSFALLHCISSYPVPDEQLNLCWIAELVSAFGVPVGCSDHATDLNSGALAVAAGAVLIEKHLTYDRRAKGPDHAASLDPAGFAEYVERAHRAHIMMGKPGKRVLDLEADVRRVSRQSLVIARQVAAGARLTDADVTTQRPGTGIPAARIDYYIGRITARDLQAGTMLEESMFTGTPS